jgi:RHS repeat-associated protein
LQDGQGSTRTLTNSAGVVTDTYDYTAFGEIYSQSGTTENKYLYTGQQFDEPTGLYSLRARFYNPAVGRFLSQDTYPVNFGNPIELNRYAYAGNNPVSFSDPSGNGLDYGMLLNVLGGAARGVALGFVVGSVYGIISSYLCGGGLNLQYVLQSGLYGAAGGALVGAAGGLSIWAGASASTIFSLGGMYAAHQELQRHGDNLCTVLNAIVSIIALTGSLAGFAGGFTGGGPGSSFALAGNNGYNYSYAPVAQGVNTTGVTTVAGTLGILSLMASTGGQGGGDGPYIPRPGESIGAGRGTKIPRKGLRGVYEFWDSIRNGWYVGSAFDRPLSVRLQEWITSGNLKSWDDVVWTEIKGSPRAIQIAERIRIEQVAKMVGGRGNMANSPTSNPASQQSVINWFAEGWPQKVPGWPNWLINPFSNP